MGKRSLGYLSGAPRVSTRPEAEMVGPKTHILGVIKGFEAWNWEVKPFIVGDRVPLSWIKKGSEQGFHNNLVRVFFADLARIIMGLINSFRALFELDQEVDWVYERLAVFQSLGWIFKLRGKKWILETNAPLSLESKSDRKTILLNPLATYLEYKAYKNCDVLVCVSETLKNIIIEQTGIPPQKAIVVPNGVDVSIFNPSLYEPIRMFNGFTIGFVGNFASWQGLELLLGAIHEIREQGVIINLTLVGDGPERIDLENITRNLGLSDIVKYVGFVPQNKVPEYISGFDIGYSGQTERTEQRMYCSPIKIYEYMAMAKSVIASDYEDTRKVINSSNGFLFEIGNQDDLVDKILHAYNVEADLNKMGLKAREGIIQNHSWESRISYLIAKINEIENS